MMSWEVRTLQEICTPKEGLKRGPFGSAIKKDFFVSEGYKVYEQSNAIYDDAHRGNYFITEQKYEELKQFKINPGDLIVSCSGTIGKISIIPNDARLGVINQALLRIRLAEDVILKKYFIYLFRSAHFQRKILVQSQGTAMMNLVGMKDFKQIQIPLPDLPTQNLIVSKIEELFSELDKGVEEIKRAQEQVKIYRQSVLKWAFEGRLTNKNVKDGELPGGWEWKKLVEITSIIGDGLHGTPKYSENGDYYFINGNNLQFGKVLIKENTKKVDAIEFEKHKKQLNDSTIFVSINGTIGNTAFYDSEKIVLGKSVCYLNLLAGYNKYYVRYFLLTNIFLKYANIKATGSTIKNVGLKAIRELQIPITTPKEQNLIVQQIESRFSLADQLEKELENSLQQAEALRQSILKKAFEGKLV